MIKNYFVYIIICTFLIIPKIYASPIEKSLPVKKANDGSFYVTSELEPNWSYSCEDGIEVELISLGLKNNLPATLAIPHVENVEKVIVELVYKTKNPGSSIQVEDDKGNFYTAERGSPAGSNDVWYYRTELPATSSVSYSNTYNEEYAQSMLTYVFRKKNTGLGSTGFFTAISGYNNVKNIALPITTDTGPRSVNVQLPISELTDDGRYIHIELSADDGSYTELTDVITEFPDGNCCIKIYDLQLDNVAGYVDEIKIKIDSRNYENGLDVKGQSWVMAGSVKTDVKCSCVDNDTEPPVPVVLDDHRILVDPGQMPKVTFTDDCSAVDIIYHEYFDVVESCWLNYGPLNSETNFVFENLPFDENHHWESGYFERFNDSSVKVHGRVVNNTDTSSGWIVDIYFESLVDYNTWLASGGTTDSDNERENRVYSKVDLSKPYTFSGFGAYKDATISIIESENNFIEIGPKDEFGDYGLGFNLAYDGIINEQAITGDIKVAASLDRCINIRVYLILREWIVSDVAGNTSVYIQRVESENQ